MKALSIRQPWASAIADGIKQVEIRTWSTEHRGDLLIHASSKYDNNAPLKLKMRYPEEDCIKRAIVAKTTLLDCMPYKQSDEFKNDAHLHLCPNYWFSNDKVGWFLFNTTKLDKPITTNGQLGLWDYAYKV